MATGRNYSVTGNCVTTSSGSTTLPLGNLVSTAAIRPHVYQLNISSAATPADNAWKFAVQRSTTVGTWGGSGGAALTPQALDSADPAAVATANQGICSAGPTLTASAFLWQQALNQRASMIWQAVPGCELVAPATANNGLALMALTGSASATEIDFCWHYTE